MKTRYKNKVYPLTAAQRLHFYSLQFCPRKEVLNIGSSITIGTQLDRQLLTKAIKEAYSRCESMRLRLAKDKDGKVYQYIVSEETREIEHFDFSHWKEEHAKAKMEEWTQTPFERLDSALNRIVIIKTPDNFEGVFMVVDHMTMDAQSLIAFFKDIIEIYAFYAYANDYDIKYPKEMASYLEQLQKDLAYENGSAASEKDREFFYNLIESSEPIFAGISGKALLNEQRIASGNPNQRAALYVAENINASISNFNLEAEPSMALIKFCQENGVSMVCLLLMALRTYLQKENDLDDISITTTVARRATLKERTCGGSRIHCFPFRTIVPRNKTFLEGILTIRDEQNKYFRHANFDPIEYYAHRTKHYNLSDGQTYEPLSLTYQPLSLQSSGLSDLGDIEYKAGRYSNGVAAHAMYLTVSHRTSDNGLEFGFEYQTGTISHDRIEYVYYYICKILFEGVNNPQKTIGEIIDLV